MKKTALFLLFLFLNCQEKIDSTDLSKINGYWEIEKVIEANNNQKDYKINEYIDWFKLSKNKGIRKKVMPQLNGKYVVNNQFENLNIIQIGDKTYIKYITKFATWKEQILEITENELVIKNDQGIKYFYKRHIPFKLK